MSGRYRTTGSVCSEEVCPAVFSVSGATSDGVIWLAWCVAVLPAMSALDETSECPASASERSSAGVLLYVPMAVDGVEQETIERRHRRIKMLKHNGRVRPFNPCVFLRWKESR